MREACFGHVESALKIDVEDSVESVVGELGDGGGEVSGGSVDEDVDASEGFDGLGDDGFYGFGLADIGCGGEDGVACDVLDFVAREVEIFLFAACDGDVCAVEGECVCDAFTDTGAASGD